jgi:hypothetical protein
MRTYCAVQHFESLFPLVNVYEFIPFISLEEILFQTVYTYSKNSSRLIGKYLFIFECEVDFKGNVKMTSFSKAFYLEKMDPEGLWEKLKIFFGLTSQKPVTKICKLDLIMEN